MKELKQKKICFVLPKFVTFSTGGAELQVYFLSEEFLKNGWEVELLVSDYGDKEAILKSKFYNHSITYNYYKIMPFFRSLEFFSVFFKLLATNSNMYYQRTDHALTGAVAFYCKLFRKKMVYAIAHDDELKAKKYSKEFSNFPYKSRIKKIIRSIDIKIIDYLVEYGKKNAHFVLTQTDYQKQLFEKNFDRKAYLVRNSFLFRPENISKKENIILWVANFRAVKQAEIFIKLAQETLLPGWKFIMMGDLDGEGQKEHYTKLLEHVNNENFAYVGHVSYHETLKWFERAKILVSTSLQEGFSNTFIQAWVYKVLLISMNVDPDNLIRNKAYGILTGPNFQQLKDTLVDVTMHFDDYTGITGPACEFAVKEFNINVNFKKIIDIISDEDTAC